MLPSVPLEFLQLCHAGQLVTQRSVVQNHPRNQNSFIFLILQRLRGEYGSVGDFIGTSKALRAVVGDRMFWEDPKEQSVAPAADLVQ